LRLQSLITACPVKGAEALCARHGADGSTSFDTYFNIFTCALWKKYTTAEGFALHVEVENEGEIILYADGSEICRRALVSGWNDIPFDAADARAVWFVVSDKVRVLSGEYTAQSADIRDVRIALNICTYRREDYIYRNTSLVRDHIWNNDSSPLKDRLDVYISDNAGTLEFIDGAKVFKNRNVGGSGGFARGLMEILEEGSATHAVFMDDDVTLMPESLERLYAFLSTVRDEYVSVPVGGAMLRLDKPCVQHESLAEWHGLLSTSLKTDLDLSVYENVAANLDETAAHYSAWWFSCVPASAAREKGLPLPIFVRMDDVEYGLRQGISPIAVPGICVWHEPFERKHSAGTEYYHARNCLIVNSLRTPGYPAVKLLFRLVMGTLMRYRYLHVQMVLDGIEDFLKGPEYLMNLDPQTFNAGLPKLDIIKTDDPDEAALKASDAMQDTPKRKLISMLTLNGAIFPAKDRAWVHAHINPVWAHFAKREAVNVIADTGTGFIVKRNNREALALSFRAAKVLLRLRKEWPVISEKWREAEKTLISFDFWKEYLGIR